MSLHRATRTRRLTALSAALVALLLSSVGLAASAVAATPGVRLSGAHPLVPTATEFPTTITVTSPGSGALWVSTTGGGTSSVCTPVVRNAARTLGSATCWVTAGKPGVYLMRAVLHMSGARTVTSAPWKSTVRARYSTEVSAATYARILKCANTTAYVWLTFDDVGSYAQVTSILATLKRNNVKGRFFPTGTWASAHPSLIARMKADGHIIDNHTWTHARLTGISNAAVLTQIDRGARPSTSARLLRPPGGGGAFTSRLTSLAASRGYRVCYWTVDTQDWARPSAAKIIYRVRYGDATTPRVRAGGVILMHMSGLNTGAALQGVINAVRARGLQLQPRH